MSLAFMRVDAPGAVARSPMEGCAAAAGARFEVRDGWNIAASFPGAGAPPVGWADVSHLRKLETILDTEFGTAERRAGAWWCRLTGRRGLVVGGDVEVEGAVDVTTCWAALTVVGPRARETIARFCALDLRPALAPPGALRPGSIARQPGIVICEDLDRYLLLFGWATGEYMWSVVSDAARHLGGRPLGVDACNVSTSMGRQPSRRSKSR